MAYRTKLASAVISGAVLAFSMSGIASAADDIATGSAYSADSLTFERWCSEIQHFDAARCAKRSSADVGNYQIAVSKLDAVEIKYKRDQRKERDFEQSFSLYQTPNPSDPLK